MIQVENLAKHYGPAVALRGIDFRVARGEIVGFLGPNGAGKSTTMKILTGYLSPTAGRATVDGLDVVTESLEVRRRIGYLPESTPLYADMSVRDYLGFAARIRGLRGAAVRPAIERVVELCGLARVFGKGILELSKGYRQRVGLAQAMVHEPELLILDEPTSGLDPNQIVEVRSLIQRLRESHTVLLSTHYLQEVEAACSRVIVIDRGRIVADGTQAELRKALPGRGIRARIGGERSAVLAALQSEIEGLEVSHSGAEDEYLLTGVGGDAAAMVARSVVAAGFTLHSLEVVEPTLEDAFRALTVGTTGVQHA
ncbi:MAG: ABC transporter ATP-binding protein [Planctomycetota bacterium]